jgi:hypothetical protein
MALWALAISASVHIQGGRAMGILRAATVAGAFLTATIAFAVGDIPTMYTGSFPSTARISGITGTFKGTSLVLKGFNRRGAVSGRYACTRTSPTQTRCTGTVSNDDGSFSIPHTVEITWGGGQPVAMTGSH